MLFLTFRIGADRYAIDAAQIVEVLPLLTLRPIPEAPPGVAGVFLYRGTPIPAIDMSVLLVNRAADARASTRLLVVNYTDRGGKTRPLGLVAERATSTMRRDRTEFVWSGVTSGSAAAGGPFAADGDGFVQWIDPQTMLPTVVRDRLFEDGHR